MIPCPYCGYKNIAGADVCEECGASLSDLHLAEPATEVEKHLLSDRIPSLEPKTPIAVTPDTPTGEVLQLLVSRRIGIVLVQEGEKLVGVFSEHDALTRLSSDISEFSDRPISDFMTQQPRTLQQTAKVAFAVQRMDLGGHRHLPVVDETDRPTGMISTRDILQYLADKMQAV